MQLANCVRTNTASSFSLPTLRVSRLLVEMREMAANPHPKYDCYVSEADMFFWKVVIEGVSLTCTECIFVDLTDARETASRDSIREQQLPALPRDA